MTPVESTRLTAGIAAENLSHHLLKNNNKTTNNTLVDYESVEGGVDNRRLVNQTYNSSTTANPPCMTRTPKLQKTGDGRLSNRTEKALGIDDKANTTMYNND